MARPSPNILPQITFGDDDSNNLFLSQDGVNNDADRYDLFIPEDIHPDIVTGEGSRPLIDEYRQDGIGNAFRTDLYRRFNQDLTGANPVRPANRDRWNQDAFPADKPSEGEEGFDEPGEYRPFHPYGDDQFFRSVEQLKEVGYPIGGYDDPSITSRTFRQLRNLVTVSSYADRTIHLTKNLGEPDPDPRILRWLGAESRDIKLNPNFADPRTISDTIYKLYYDRYNYDLYRQILP
ncbi:MAG: hypothetical protein J7M12_00005, partial [Candidatus Hydrogenedentes bacterium]|nr:hypothetical protein [Candidatus Hydrogenedentota bacterium]